MKDDPIHCSILPFNPFDYWDRSPVDPAIQRDELWDCLNAAYRNREDRWQAVKIIIQAERLVAEYMEFGCDSFLPLQEVLHDLFRVERRLFIRRALLCREQDRPTYKEALKKWDCDADAADDFRVVERHLSEGRALFEDLRQRCKA